MKNLALKNQDYEQIDLFDELESTSSFTHAITQDYFDPWDNTRGRNIIKALGKDGKDVTLYFDALDQQYHLFEE